MSDKMNPIPFGILMEWIRKEKQERGSVCFVRSAYQKQGKTAHTIFQRKLEHIFGPAAGPHTQLAQNIVSAYYAGARFFELKTVQMLDGDDLPVEKPCIKVEKEAYNVEWSTELYVQQALEEYIKAWFALSFLAKEYGLGDQDGFVFNMSVGYDLEGIKSKKINDFLENMRDATQTSIYWECRNWLFEHVSEFDHMTREDIERISPYLCNSVTLSTLHGCPPAKIERIASYLLYEKKFHTFIKLNPTLLGYEKTRGLMDEMGYQKAAFGRFHFEDDLQYKDAVPMLERLQQLAAESGLEFGVKVTNTFPVDITQGELPGKEMYLSGSPLYVLSLSVAALLTETFAGKLRISYSGGADALHIKQLTAAGIWPVTMATTLLKPGGYQRFTQIAKLFDEDQTVIPKIVDGNAVTLEIEKAKKEGYCRKDTDTQEYKKMEKVLPMTDCFMAPCEEGCPIHQDVAEYMAAAQKGDMEKAFAVIIEKNPFPFTTGTICPHTCMSKCSRNFYEESVKIRRVKLEAAQEAYEAYMEKSEDSSGSNVCKTGRAAIIGAGPAGIAAAHFLAREGMAVTVYDKEARAGGVVRHCIPEFRIAQSELDKDIHLTRALGVTWFMHTEIADLTKLISEYDAVILAIGASKPGELELEEGKAVNALAFLREYQKGKGHIPDFGGNVVVIGGGNTAIDTARAAKRVTGVKTVQIVYRRTKQYMPADREEIETAEKEGIQICELQKPIRFHEKTLTCEKMKLGSMGTDRRQNIEGTGEYTEISADMVLAATGETIDSEFYQRNGVEVSKNGKPRVDAGTLETSVQHVYAIGDGCNGPATVVKAIRDAAKAAEAILKANGFKNELSKEGKDGCDINTNLSNRGILEGERKDDEAKRCLQCSSICEMCVEVCPNRANISVQTKKGRRQIIHLDPLCNECGNCMNFCPYEGAPYLNKFTYFASKEDMQQSKNMGFAVLDKERKTCFVRFNGAEFEVTNNGIKQDSDIPQAELPEEISELMMAFMK